jgi:hypothetical protein
MSDNIVARLRRLDDGVSRPVSMIEREVCGHAANAIEALSWVRQVHPSKNADGNACVVMTWEQWRDLQRLAGFDRGSATP